MAEGARAWFATEDQTGLVPQRSEKNKTGFLDVNKVRGGYQVKAWDANIKRQRGLPGVWSTAEEAAMFLACAKRMGMQQWFFDALGPPAQRKPRGSKGVRLPLPTHICTRLTAAACVHRSGQPSGQGQGQEEEAARQTLPEEEDGARQPASRAESRECASQLPALRSCACGATLVLVLVLALVLVVVLPPMVSELSPRSLEASRRVQVLQIM